MREIKFRVYDIKKKLFTNYQIKDDMIFCMDKITGVWIRVKDESRFKIMQYTGLKDKHGIKIYEGDIVEFYEVGKMWKAKIGYDSGAFTVDFGGGFYYLCGYSMESNLFEVIGNIYDNLELLEESD